MYLKEIITDSLRYPFSDWKRFFFLGIIIFISAVNIGFYSSIIPLDLMGIKPYLFWIIEFILGLLILGYAFKIIRSSLEGDNKLPEFNSPFNMLKAGINVLLLMIIFHIPIILMILISIWMIPSNLVWAVEIFGSFPSNFFTMLYIMRDYLAGGILAAILINLYLFIVYPFLKMGIANMAYTDGKLSSGLRFREIINKIASIGWKNFIVWFVVVDIIKLLIETAYGLIVPFLLVLIFHFAGIKMGAFFEILRLLIVVPFISIYFNRAAALFYMSE